MCVCVSSSRQHQGERQAAIVYGTGIDSCLRKITLFLCIYRSISRLIGARYTRPAISYVNHGTRLYNHARQPQKYVNLTTPSTMAYVCMSTIKHIDQRTSQTWCTSTIKHINQGVHQPFIYTSTEEHSIQYTRQPLRASEACHDGVRITFSPKICDWPGFLTQYRWMRGPMVIRLRPFVT